MLKWINKLWSEIEGARFGETIKNTNLESFPTFLFIVQSIHSLEKEFILSSQRLDNLFLIFTDTQEIGNLMYLKYVTPKRETEKYIK